MGSDASTPQEEPLIPQDGAAETLPNGTEDPPQPQPSDSTIEASDPKSEQIAPESKSQTAATTEEAQSTEMKESTTPTDQNQETSSNPYIDANLADAQKEYNPEKNKEFEEQHAVPQSETSTTEIPAESKESVPDVPPTKPAAPTTAAPPKPKSKPKSKPIMTKSTYEPEKASMEVKRKIEGMIR